MSLKNLDIKRSYSSDTDDILNDFYVPALSESREYWRLAGFFCSSSLTVAARGLLGLLSNGGSMRLVACPRLTKPDVEAIVRAEKPVEACISDAASLAISEIADTIAVDHVAALGWLVEHDRLQIRLCVPTDLAGNPQPSDYIEAAGIFHQKVGVLTDSAENRIAFSGSVNETATAWLGNIEEFKVFRSWSAVENDYVEADLSKFLRFWDGTAAHVRTYPVPEAVRQNLISYASQHFDEARLGRWYPARPASPKMVVLYPYQREAVEAWFANGRRGLFEMATGTGKTYTALGCITKVQSDTRPCAIVISAPFQHLLNQWHREMQNYGLRCDRLLFAESGHPAWKTQLACSLLDLSLGDACHLVVLATHAALTSPDFADIMDKYLSGTTAALVADEVHRLGAEHSRSRLGQHFSIRLGLSATPHRWFDEAGTEALVAYFGGVVYEFSLSKAITTINPGTGETFLAPYRYIPHVAALADSETDEYLRITQQIVSRLAGRSLTEVDDPNVERLLFARADLIKNAFSKYAVLRALLRTLGSDARWTLLYCSPQQMDTTMALLRDLRWVVHRFTMDEGTVASAKYGGLSERDYLLRRFAAGEYQALIAMKCLDEGVDVPAARVAILLCSSGNPREYIQRIGRVIRRCDGKQRAEIHDVIVGPVRTPMPHAARAVERDILRRELRRCDEIAALAENSAEAIAALANVMDRSFEG